MVFHWSLSDRRTLLGILANLNNAVVWMVSTRPLIFKFIINPLVTLPSAPITIGITVTFMFYSFFFSPLARSRYLSFFSLSVTFTLWIAWTAKFIIRQVLFFLFLWTITRSGCLAEIRGSVCIWKSQGILSFSFSRTDSGLWIHHFFVWSNFNFLRNSQWTTLPTIIIIR